MSRPVRIALLHSAGAAGPAALAAALRAAGERPALLTTEPAAAPAGVDVVALRVLPERPLRARGIGDHLEHLPHALLALARGRYDVVHAFRPVDAVAAAVSTRGARRAAVLTVAEPLRRETIADRRLRLESLEAAVARVDAVLAGSEEARASLRRLLALDARVVAPGDAAAHLALYRDLVSG